MTKPDIVFIHRGGLGDFLMAWPTILSICGHFPDNNRFWVGSSSRLPWLKPLGVQSCPGNMQRAFHSLFASRHWPQEFANARLYWFCLNTRPPVREHPDLFFLEGLRPNTHISPREMYADGLRTQGVPFNAHWLETWRGFFGPGTQKRRPKTGRALFFPGAGHPAKQWPLVQFFELACWLENQGMQPQFVLGPAEVERGMRVAGFPVACPSSLVALQDVLNSADVVVGNDSGPMHLAGMLGLPGLALFGPASEEQWAPVGLRALGAQTVCRPCTANGNIRCTDARCMRELVQEVVRRELTEILFG